MISPVRDETLDAASRLADEAAPEDAFVVDVLGFEGPLHLLLDMARRQKVDLLHVSILELAEQYLAFILDAREKRMDLAADYLLMAAWLAYLKSRLLLPKPEKSSDQEPEGEGMARRLAFRLARLAAMREAVQSLNGGDVTGRDVFVRGMRQETAITRRTTYDTSLYDLMKAFADIQGRKVKVRAHVVRRQPVLALESARRSLKKIAPRLDDWARIQALEAPADEQEDTPRKSVVASYFAAALELTRDRAVDLRQDAPLADLFVRRAQAEQAEAETMS